MESLFIKIMPAVIRKPKNPKIPETQLEKSSQISQKNPQKISQMPENQLPDNNLDYQENIENHRPEHKSFSIGKLISLSLIIASLFFLVAGAWFGYQISTSNKNTKESMTLINLIPQVGRFFAGGRTTLKGEDIGRTNILLLGLDVEAGLTDSIILVSYFHREKKITTVNIPRDFYVNIPGLVTEKINAIYPYAKKEKPNDANYPAEVLTNFIASEFGIDVHYWAVTNFAGVREVIDTLGGVPVNVDNDFVDYEFPKDDYSGYMVPAPSFKKGVENMDGTRAMIYARSRHGTGVEGSDFARSRRQSIVLQAILEKIKSQGIFGNLTQINNYLNILGNNLQTNMKTEEMLAFADISREINVKTSFLRANWNNSLDFLCDGQNEFGAYILTYGQKGDCGYTAGTPNGSSSIYSQKARSFIQNILVKTQNEKIFELKTLILGNNSDQSLKVQKSLAALGFKNVEINNNYAKIKKATLNSTEEINIIGPENLQQVLPTLTPDFSYTFYNQNPEKFILPSNTADVIIWVE